VFIFGGSAGARRLNQVLPHALALLHAGKDLRVIHQTGQADCAEVCVLYTKLGIDAEVVPFIEHMQEIYSIADLVVCRSGAMTVAELTALGKPAILIPYPYAADDHQRANAEVLVQAGAARMVLDTEFTPERMSQEILTLITDRSRLERMAQAAATLGRPDATRAIVRECLACLSPSESHTLESSCR
jgi:UDP-N-acetylglucosamine--N-acetylmuramyl-(pentapeptide) pyrophosphoryl-undecaprenol N-acetylglucosamine transferase